MIRNLIIFGTLISIASLFIALGNAEDTDGSFTTEAVTQPVVQTVDQLDTTAGTILFYLHRLVVVR